MIIRSISDELKQAYSEYPVITILGPRQSGKTTLARMTFPDKPYFTLEDPDIRMAAETDPRGFLRNLKKGGILDEIQRLPVLLSYLQGIVDQGDRKVKFILTGSHQPLLQEDISQSLAGRTAILNLWPFSIDEISNYKTPGEPFDLIYRGFYPGLYEHNLEPRRFFNSYLQTYIERDVRALMQLRDLSQFQGFIKLLAGRIGQIINYTSLSNDVGVSATTIKKWVSVLKSTYVVYELPPYFENIRKRIVKSPKILFADTGLASFLLGISSPEQAARDPLRGALYENMVISEIVKLHLNLGIRPDIYFYRDSYGNEVDLVIRSKGQLVPIEIKSSETFTGDFIKGLLNFKSLNLPGVADGFVLYNGKQRLTVHDIEVLNPLEDMPPAICGQ